MPQATAGFKAAQVPVRFLLQAIWAEESFVVVEHLVLELLEVAGRAEDSMVEDIDNSIRFTFSSEGAFDTNYIRRKERCLNI